MRCPEGFITVRNADFPVGDQCLICPAGKYSIVPALYTNLNKTVGDAKDVSSKCNKCPSGADCSGGQSVIPRAGTSLIPQPSTLKPES